MNLKKYKLKEVIVFIIIIMTTLLTYNDGLQENFNKETIIKYAVSTIILVIILSISIIVIKKYKDWEIHKLFLVLSLFIGIPYMILSPFISPIDEIGHFSRAYEISEGMILPAINSNENGTIILPKELDEHNLYNLENVLEKYNKPLNKTELQIQENLYTEMHSPLQYIPQVIGIQIGKILNLSAWGIGMLGRICNYIFYIIMCCIGLKLLPRFKLTTMLILLSPAFLNLATSLSADIMIITCSFLFIAYIMNIIYEKRKMKTKEFCILLILSIFISVVKVVYLPIVLCILLIPKEYYNKKYEKAIYIVFVFLISILANLVWMILVRKFMFTVYPESTEQIIYMLTHPFNYICAIIRTYFNDIIVDILGLVAGDQLNTARTIIYVPLSILFWVIIIKSTFIEAKENILTKKQKVIILIAIVSVLIILPSIQYIYWGSSRDEVGGKFVPMLYARYFMPVLLLTINLIPTRDKKELINNCDVITKYVIMYFPVYVAIMRLFLTNVL